MITFIRFKIILAFLTAILLFVSCNPTREEEDTDKKAEPKIAVVIHRGTGSIRRERMDSISEQACRQTLNAALDTAYTILESGGESCEAIMAAIVFMENSPLFNAGYGAVLTSTGENELGLCCAGFAIRCLLSLDL